MLAFRGLAKLTQRAAPQGMGIRGLCTAKNTIPPVPAPAAVPADAYPVGTPLDVSSEDELQPQWRALENRVNNRKSKKKGEGPSGRGPRRSSAWDHDTV